MNKNEISDNVVKRVNTVRIRTWTLTLAIITALVLYFLVNVIMKQSIDVVDFVFMATIQILTHCLYFPDGDLFGQKDNAFIKNKEAYNLKAEQIIEQKMQGKLREYCKVEFEQRKERYKNAMLSYLDITQEEYDLLKTKSEEEILSLDKFEYVSNGQTRVLVFNKSRRKGLHKLLFKPIPVTMNEPELIMSGIENNRNLAIRDESISYKVREYIKKFIMAIIFGAFLAYIGYTIKDGVSFADIVKIVTDLVTLMSTAVMSFSSGENCSRVYKKNFYLNLSNFIDGFMEWNGR